MGKLHSLPHLEHLLYVTSGKAQFWGSAFPLGVSSQDSWVVTMVRGQVAPDLPGLIFFSYSPMSSLSLWQ